jgi:hypothetical protein
VTYSSTSPGPNAARHGALIATALASLVLGACSHGNPKALPSATHGTASSTALTAEPTTTQPPATDDVAVRPVISGLLHQWDVSMTAILAKPKAVLNHPDSPLRQPFNAIFTSDSPNLRDINKLAKSYVARDLVDRAGPSGVSQHTVYLRTTQAPNASWMTFVWCSFDDSTSYNSSTSKVVSNRVGITQGAGEAKRIAGRWRLYRLYQLGETSAPAGSPDPCPSYATPPQTSTTGVTR